MPERDAWYEVTLATEHLKTIRVRAAYVSVDERLFPGWTQLKTEQGTIAALVRSGMTLRRGDTVSRDAVVNRLVALGYRREPAVSSPGEFSVRGGIVDAFGPDRNRPWRAADCSASRIIASTSETTPQGWPGTARP